MRIRSWILAVVTVLFMNVSLLWGAVQKPLLQKSTKLPVYFVENAGQTKGAADYVVTGKERTIFFNRQGLTFSFMPVKKDAPLTPVSFRKDDKPVRWNVKLEFIGSNAESRPVGMNVTPAVVNYFHGKRQDWKANVRTFGSLKYSNLWPGVDLTYTGAVDQVKYAFTVAPGADPADIRLAYRGAEVRLNQEGELVASTPAGSLNDPKPLAYQNVEGKRVEVPVAYVLENQKSGASTYHFRIGKYDRSRALVIDPAHLVFSGYIGGSEADFGTGIAITSQGYVYVAGTTGSMESTFPVSFGPDLTYNGSQYDGFVAKFTNNGQTLLYVGYIGGCGSDYILEVAADDRGYAYVTGSTDSPECFPLLRGPDLTWNGGGADAFITKIYPDGSALVYSGFIGGAGIDDAIAVALDPRGSAYVVGLTNSDQTTFPVLGGPMLAYNGGDWDVFVTRVHPNGAGLVYSGFLGGQGRDVPADIAVDAFGNAYILGDTDSTQSSFPVVIGPDLTFNGVKDAFVTKLDPWGLIAYSGYIGGAWPEYAEGVDGGGIAVDKSGNAYVIGSTQSDETSFPVLVGPDKTYNSLWFGGDAFVAKVHFDGSTLDYCGYIGGQNNEYGSAIAIDSSGFAYVTGSTESDETSFPVVDGPDLTHNGGNDAFVAKIEKGGAALLYCGYIGGDSDDVGDDIAFLKAHVYVIGTTRSDQATFPVIGAWPYQTYGGNSDAFVARVAP